ncbi:MAG: hypothetical protein GY797_25845 [Deltaproteobacteria bacterium]|nr:hypothetical protein [Deltaproteobacteria bacterium]
MENKKKTFCHKRDKLIVAFACVVGITLLLVAAQNAIAANDKRQVIKYKDGKYEGKLRDGKRDGYGVFTWSDGTKYEGEWRNDKKDGHGVFTWPDGTKYDGELRNDKFDGQGVYTTANGDIYEGGFRNDKRHGYGVYTSKNGNTYEGEWRNDQQHGKGGYTLSDGTQYAEEWRNGERIMSQNIKDREFIEGLDIGETISLRKSMWGIFGRKDVVIVRFREKSPRIKVQNIDTGKCTWLNASDLITEKEHKEERSKFWLDYLESITRDK